MSREIELLKAGYRYVGTALTMKRIIGIAKQAGLSSDADIKTLITVNGVALYVRK